MTGQFSVLFKKYSVPIILLILALAMLIVGIKDQQGSTFMISSVMMFAASGISLLYSSGKFKPFLATIIGAVAGLIALFLFYQSYDSVVSTDTYNKNYNKCKLLAQQNLEDIRYVQKAYAEQNGVYISDWNSFTEFIRNGKVPFVDAQGVVPNRKITPEENNFLYPGNPPIDNNMTETEAFRLSKWIEGPNWQVDFANFKRDTIMVSLYDTKFKSRSYRENREKLGFYEFNPDSLPIIPFTKKEWKLETLDSIQVGDAKAPAMRVSGLIPFAEIQGKNDDTEEMYFGSLTTPDLDGSWESE